MREFIYDLIEHNFRGRTVAFIENGSWAPVAARVMRTMLEKAKDIIFAENTITLRSALQKENEAQLNALADELTK